MFSSPLLPTDKHLMAQVLTSDVALGRRIRTALEAGGRFHVDVSTQPLVSRTGKSGPQLLASLLIVDLNSQAPDEFTALEQMLKARLAPSAVIVISDLLAGDAARRLLRLQVSDLLPRTFTDPELIAACGEALAPSQSNATANQAHCTAFWPVLGGAGATTLSIAAASVLAGSKRDALADCCIIDLNFQSGTLGDHLDLEPHLQLAEIAGSPERLDAQMLEVMLSRHASGLAILAAPPSFGAFEEVDADIVGKLLDLAAHKFKHLIIDLPRSWLPWTETVMRGSDALYVVTDLSITGLRQARRTADMLAGLGMPTDGTVIVNKTPWIGGGGFGKVQARKMLANSLGGFVTDCRGLARDAQTRGVLLSQIKKRNRIEADLGVILRQPRIPAPAAGQ